MEQLLTVGTAARLIGISPDLVRHWADTGRLRCVRTTTGLRLFERRDVDAIAAERRTTAV